MRSLCHTQMDRGEWKLAKVPTWLIFACECVRSTSTHVFLSVRFRSPYHSSIFESKLCAIRLDPIAEFRLFAAAQVQACRPTRRNASELMRCTAARSRSVVMYQKQTNPQKRKHLLARGCWHCLFSLLSARPSSKSSKAFEWLEVERVLSAVSLSLLFSFKRSSCFSFCLPKNDL